MTSTRDRLERAAYLAVLLARHTDGYPNVIAARVTHLQRLAHQAQRAEENYCNVPDYPRDRTMARLQKHADKIADELGVKVELGGDCRGACAWLTIPGAPGDGWHLNAYAIY